jgi:hypothetical protein
LLRFACNYDENDRRAGNESHGFGSVIPMNERSYYDVLGVGKDADEKAIKSAFRKKAMECHPATASVR